MLLSLHGSSEVAQAGHFSHAREIAELDIEYEKL